METSSTSYKIEMLHMALPKEQMDELIAQGTGGISFDLPATSGGRFVFALYSPEYNGAIASFSVDTSAPQTTRRFFLLPLAHGFSTPAELDMCPLGALLHTSGMLVLYEVKNAAN